MTSRQVGTIVAALSALLALGCAALAVAHMGLQVPLLSRLGPGGSRAIVPAAVAFIVATLVLGAVAFGVARGRSWSWPAGILVHGVVFLGAAFPYRGVVSLAGMLIAGTCVALLLTRAGREGLLAR